MKRVCLLILVFASLVARPVAAQSSDVAHLVTNLILRGIQLPGADSPGNPHAGHFTLGDPTLGGSQQGSVPDAGAIGAVVSFNDRFRNQITNYPLGTSAGGFNFILDPSTGTYSRATTGFGPSFSERATTIGHRKVGFSFNYQHSGFDTFGGEELGDGSISFFLPHTDCCPAADPHPASPGTPFFEGDLIQAQLHLKAKADTYAFFGTYGVTNNFDVGIVAPIVHVSLDASIHATIIRLSTASASTTIHTFVQGQDVSVKDFFPDASQQTSATGIGDIVLRGKYRLPLQGTAKIAAALDLRLPTGDEDNLLGAGTTQAKIYGIVSAGKDKWASHLNLGFTVSGTGDRPTEFGVQTLGVSDEFNLTGGFEYVAHPKLTVSADFIQRTLFDAGKVDLAAQSYQFKVATDAATDPFRVSTVNPITNQPYNQLTLTSGNLNQALGAVGAKVNVGPNFLVTGNVLFPFTNGGLRDRSSFSFGIDYTF